MKTQKIIQLLEEPMDDRRQIKKEIEDKASIEDLQNALRFAKKPITKQILCELLGNRQNDSAIPILLNVLQDETASVRAAAADAISKIRCVIAGKPLMDQLVIENDKGAKQMIILALGAVGYSPAIPKLIECLSDSNGTLRGCAAWSLGTLNAKEARKIMLDMLQYERNEYAKKRLTEALIMTTND
jgi:HEAT repeat protein